jgi:DNA-binding CsgD family transcriptional regulator
MNVLGEAPTASVIPRHSFVRHEALPAARHIGPSRWVQTPQHDGTVVGYRVRLNSEDLEYRLVADGDGHCCQRTLFQSDGSELAQSLPVADIESLCRFIDGDAYADELRVDLDRFVDLCTSHLGASDPVELPAPADADETQALLCSLADSSGLSDLLDRSRAVVRYAGGEQFLFVLAKRESHVTHLNYLIGCDPRLLQLYVGRRWHAVDPFAIYASRGTQCLSTSELELRSRGQVELRAAMAESGFASAMAIPVRLSSTLYGYLLVGNSRPGYAGEDILRRNRAVLRLVAMEIFDWVRRHAYGGVTLTDDERRLLLFVDEGLESREVAAIMGTTEGVVNKRYCRINSKFKVRHKGAALQAAVDLGLLQPAFSAAA